MSQVKYSKILTFLLIIIFLCVGAVFLRYFGEHILGAKDFFYLKKLEVYGNNYITQEDIFVLARLRRGDKILSQNIEDLEKRVKQNPYVRNVRIERRLPATLLVVIEEERPLAYVTGKKKVMIISDSCRLLPRAIDFDFPDLPLIVAKLDEKYKIGDIVSQKNIVWAVDFFQLAQIVSIDLYSLISEIDMDGNKPIVRLSYGGAILDYAEENMAKQLLNFSYFLDKKADTNFLSGITRIDIRFSDRVILKRGGSL